jgi:hypothetical protein
MPAIVCGRGKWHLLPLPRQSGGHGRTPIFDTRNARVRVITQVPDVDFPLRLRVRHLAGRELDCIQPKAAARRRHHADRQLPLTLVGAGDHPEGTHL